MNCKIKYRDVLKGNVLGLMRRFIFKYPTSFMTSLVKWCHCLLIEKKIIIICLTKLRCMRIKIAEKQSKEPKSY